MLTGNMKAFADTTAFSEGTYGIGDNGYNVLVGSTPHKPLLFTSYAAHPNVYNARFNSTAAGRYQIIHPTFVAVAMRRGLKDFSPDSQDDAFRDLVIRDCGADLDVIDGRFDIAVAKCARQWASFPGANAGQHEQKLQILRDFYVKAGGTLA